MKIDLHTHILPEKWPDLRERYGYGGFVRLEHHKPCCAKMWIDDRCFREVQDNAWCPNRRISDCDETGVSLQVLSTVPVMFSYWAKPDHAHDLAQLLNNHLAGVVADYPDRFAGLGTLPMQEPKLAIQELERCMQQLGLAGVQIGTHIKDWNLNAAQVFYVLEAAASLGAAVFVHPWDMMGKERMTEYWLPWLVGMPAETSLAICSVIFGGVLEKLPNLRICFAHGGGSFPGAVGRIVHGFHCRPDLVAVDNNVNPREYLAKSDGTPARFWVDSLVHEEAMLRHLITLMGPSRIALGSDYPFPLGEARPGALIESMSDLSADVKEQMLHVAAREFLNLPQGVAKT